MSTYKTLLLICRILSFKSDDAMLIKDLKNADWEQIVKVASKHLVLPTVYCRLQKKEMLKYLPDDLLKYLKEITKINYERNKILLNEVKELSSILKKFDISHVFLKGSALLTLNSYNSIAERMVGDIDILIENDQLDIAYKKLTEHGYESSKTTLGSKYFEQKHLPRLIPPNALMAVELHKKILRSTRIHFLDHTDVLNNKQLSPSGIHVPSNNQLLKHIILNYQINDHGYYFKGFNLRSLYDTVVLSRNFQLNLSFLNNKYFQDFLIHGSVLFVDIASNSNYINIIKKRWFSFRLRMPWLNSCYHKMLKKIYITKILIIRLKLFFSNSEYRRDILKDWRRVSQLLLNTNEK